MKNKRFQDNAEDAARKPELNSAPEEQSGKALEKMEDFFKLRKTGPVKYKMDSEKTLEHIQSQYKGEEAQAFFEARKKAGVKDSHHVRLKGTNESFYMTGNEASGQFLSKDMPGETAEERREALQLPENNDGEDVYLVHLNRPSIVIESKIAPQEEFAEKAGYKAREGGKQIFVPPKFGDMSYHITVQEQVTGNRPHKSEQENGKSDSHVEGEASKKGSDKE